MFKLTEALRKHAREVLGAPADMNDADLTKFVAEKFQKGTVSFDDLAKLSADPAPDAKSLLKSTMDEAMKPLANSIDSLVAALKAQATPPAPAAQPAPAVEKAVPAIPNPDPREVFFAGAKATDINTLDAHKQYSTTKKSAIYPQFTAKGNPHPLANRPASFCGQPLDHPSDLDMAVNGAFLKSQLAPHRMTDHEKQLLEYALRELPWTGTISGHGDGGFDDGHDSLDRKSHYTVNRHKLGEKGRKDILDDSTSGGTNAVPVTFDDAIALTPVLFGELFPLVEVKPWARGRLIDGSTMNNPTWTWNQSEGTALTPFDTTGFISAMDTTIFPIMGGVELGMDFEDDTPINFGGILVQKFGEKLSEQLDYVIASGNGTTQPQGIFNSSGYTTVTSVNAPNGPPTVSDYESLYFGLAKQFRRGDRVAFVANDTTYRRSRSIPVGPNDSRRVFGMDHASYRLMDIPYKVQNSIDNTDAACCNLAYYRMYRRLGMTVRIETGGRTLALKNERLIVVRARFGGRLTLGGALAVNSGMQN